MIFACPLLLYYLITLNMLFFKKKNLIILTAALVVAVCLAAPHFVFAFSVNDALINISSWIANQIIYVVGQLLLIAINILIKVASFNDFINANIVNIGWVIIRDIANLAIVIVLLVISFYTVLDKQTYEYKKMLPRLIAAAILVNFSKTITGLMIDVGQVIMMTFVHAFQDIAVGNLTYGFGLQDILSVRNTAQGAGFGAEISDWSVFGALVLGVIMVSVALGVVTVMAVMLLVRIVALWLLIIFSPVAYVAGLLPGGEKFSSQWWQNFSKYITFGPVLAFLFWLSMTVLSQITTNSHLMSLSLQSKEYLAGGKGAASPETYAYFASQISSPQRVFDYLVTVVLLIMCLIFAKSAGVAGSQFAGTVLNKFQGAGRWIARRPKVWGRAAGRAAQRSRVGLAVSATRERFLNDTATGRFLRSKLTEKGREEEYEERKAKMFTKYGGKKHKNDWAKYQEKKEIIEKREEMRKTNQLDYTQDELEKAFKEEVAKGEKADLGKLRIWMAEAARNDNLTLTREMKKIYQQLIKGNKWEEKSFEYHKKNLERLEEAKTDRLLKKLESPLQSLRRRKDILRAKINELANPETDEERKRLDELNKQMANTLEEIEKLARKESGKKKIEVVGAGTPVPPPEERAT